MKNLLEFLLIHLCRFPEAVKVEEEPGERETRYILHVHPEDMGRVIGKGGSVIQAIRTLAKVRAIKEGMRVYVMLAEQAEGETIEAATDATDESETTDVTETEVAEV